MKKLLFLLLIAGGIAALVMYMQKRSGGTFEDEWDSLSELPGKIDDIGSSAA
jgi:hypothetical protein